MGRVDAAVSCVGNMRPSPEFEGGSFFGLHWDFESMDRENGLLTERIVEFSQRAGAQRFVYVSVSSLVEYAYGGALEPYIDGKKRGEESVRRRFGELGACIVGPSLVYGGGRFAAGGKLLAGICRSPPVSGYVRGVRWIKDKASTGFMPQDAATEVALTPPAPVEDVARAVAACCLRATPESFVDGTDEIRRVAEQAGTTERLTAAARAMGGGGREGSAGGGSALVSLGGAEGELPQSPSAFGAPLEGALVGFRPFLYPFPPGIALVGSFAGAILYGMSHN